ncbi:hypothetical protein GUJ93_ZPchr0006g42476 [Zizania palustris]|uniref:Uncharacterized protein n=1 Tax=Zizania palustris TaxID=103762 RepID=A0A8J5SBZ3_ZIZPA|nr:hypothetical protein GUJ93_ZPchr0006g42476 [Zizania palustris]
MYVWTSWRRCSNSNAHRLLHVDIVVFVDWITGERPNASCARRFSPNLISLPMHESINYLGEINPIRKRHQPD